MIHFCRTLPVLAMLGVVAGDATAQCEQQKLQASDKQGGDQFGQSVAICGSIVVVGAPFNTDLGPMTGCAYVFERVGSTWVQTAKLLSSDIAWNHRLGFSVDVDGATIVVSTRYNDDVGYGTGAAYAFEKQGGTWVEIQKLLPMDLTALKFFGVSVSISGDVIAVGADLDDQVLTDAGAVYVFERQTSGAWIQVSKLMASDAALDDRLGTNVAVSGNRLIASAIGDDDNGGHSGSAYLFERQIWGNWTQTAKLVASDGAAADRFGHRVAIDQDTIVIGSLAGDGAQVDTGAVYVFEETGGAWPETAKLIDKSGFTLDQFGSGVGIEGDVIAVGAWAAEETPLDDSAGTIFTFRKVGNTWHPATKAQAADKSSFDGLGWSISISGDQVVTSAKGDESGAGSAYVFDNLTNSYLAGSGCGGSPGNPPGLEIKGCVAPLGSMQVLLSQLQFSEPGLLVLGGTLTDTAISPACSLYAGPPHLAFLLLPAPNSNRMDIPAVLPAAATGLAMSMQFLQADVTLPWGYRASNGAYTTVP